MVTIFEATSEDAPAIMALAVANKQALGSMVHHRQWAIEWIDRGEVFIAKTAEGELVGFVFFHHNPHMEDDNTTVYYLCTDSTQRRQGIGKRLMEAVATDARLCGNELITLRCPSHLPANHFYKSIGYALEGSETDQEGGRLNVWTLHL